MKILKWHEGQNVVVQTLNVKHDMVVVSVGRKNVSVQIPGHKTSHVFDASDPTKVPSNEDGWRLYTPKEYDLMIRYTEAVTRLVSKTTKVPTYGNLYQWNEPNIRRLIEAAKLIQEVIDNKIGL